MIDFTMSNGASATDWLGTARNAANVAATMIDRVRNNVEQDAEQTLGVAESQLMQALSELRTVRDAIATR